MQGNPTVPKINLPSSGLFEGVGMGVVQLGLSHTGVETSS